MTVIVKIGKTLGLIALAFFITVCAMAPSCT